MKTDASQFPAHTRDRRRKAFIIFGVMSATLCVVAYFALKDDLTLLLAGGVALAVGYSLFRWPEAATLGFCFILYANLAVIAVEFHGVPKVVAAAVSLVLALPLANYLFQRGERLIFDHGFRLILIYLAALVASSLLVKDTIVALNELGNFLLEGLILYFLMINVVRTLSTLKRVMWTLLLACSLLGGLSVYQEMTRTYENNYGGLAQRRDDLDISEVDFDEFGGSRRAGGPVGTENRYAQVLIVILPLALGLFYIEPRRKFKLFAVAAAGLILGGMVLTFSRGAFVTLVLLLVIIVFLRYIRPSQALFAAGLTVLIIVVSLPEYIDRVNTVTGVSNLASANDDTRELDGSLRGRFAENIAALRVFIEHPVLGVGPGQFPKFYSAKYGNEVGTKRLRSSRRAHSLYLELAAETGAIGLTAFLAIAVTTGYRLWQERRRWLRTRPDLATIATAFVLAIIAYFGTATFLHLSYQRYYWFLLALAGAAIRICRNESVPTIPAEVEEEEYYVAKHVPERAA